MPTKRLSLLVLVLAHCLVTALNAADEPQAVSVGQPSEAPVRPNFVWIMSEDNSKHYLKHFDEAGAAAPHIEAMARHGVTFDRAFSCAPVCSVARTTLITSCYAPRIGTQYHRRSKVAAMPPGLKMFPSYLREAGYFTTNDSKEDYNAEPSSPWDVSGKGASWTNRPSPDASFFHVVTFTDSHESSLHIDFSKPGNQPTTNPDEVRLQPYFPDTPLFRKTLARYHDRMQLIDNHVGEVIDELREAGELENTFVFYFGDHGGVLPRSKGYLYEAGLHVPLVVRVPDRFKDLADRELGSRTSGFVEFVDFGPTVLKLASVDIPRGTDGKPFLGAGVSGESVDARDEAIGYADRFDEKYDIVRSLRLGNWKYHRNFEAYLPDGLQNNYRYQMQAYEQWRSLASEGKLNDVQLAFFKPKDVEALYDLETDPHETHNLASDPVHAETLSKLRSRLMERLKSMPDLSFFPEAVLFERAFDSPVAFGQKIADRIGRFIDTANLSLEPFEDVKLRLRDALQSSDPWLRYWAAITCGCFGKQASELEPILRQLLDDDQPLVATRAAESLALAIDLDPRAALYRAIASARNEPETLQILNSVVFIRQIDGGKWPIDTKQVQFGFEFTNKSELSQRMKFLGR